MVNQNNQPNKILGKNILEVVVGSHAHGLATEVSDIDSKSIFVHTTSDLLKVSHQPNSMEHAKQRKIEGLDITSYEIHHFLSLAVKSNPSILEVFKSPVVSASDEGYLLLNLFPHVWSSKGVYDAYLGFSRSQRNNIIKGRTSDVARKNKYNVACLRSLLNGIEILRNGDFSIKVKDDYDIFFPIGYKSWMDFFLDVKNNNVHIEDINLIFEMFKGRNYKSL